MTYTALFPPIVYGHDTSGRPVVIDTAGPCPHVLITGGTGRGLTTLAGAVAVQAARQGTWVRACHPHPAEDAWSLGVRGITAARGPEETLELIRLARAEMRNRLAATSGGAGLAGCRRALLAVDDYDYFTAALPDDSRAEAATAIEEIAYMGRAARVTVLLTAHQLSGLSPALLDNLGTRIILGPARKSAAVRLFGDARAGRDAPHGVPGSGTASVGGQAPAAIRVTVPAGTLPLIPQPGTEGR